MCIQTGTPLSFNDGKPLMPWRPIELHGVGSRKPLPRYGENIFDELKNQWAWTGFTTHDLKGSQLMARIVALVFNWWSLCVRLAVPGRHTEAVTSRPACSHHSVRIVLKNWLRNRLHCCVEPGSTAG